MKEQTGDSYKSADTSKMLALAGAKDGKTTFLIAQALGIWPGQNGAVVDKPSHLHVIAADAAAIKGFKTFATKHLGASSDALAFRVYNIEEDVREAFATLGGWDYTLRDIVVATIQTIQQRARQEKGVHVMHVSSLTTIAQAIKRAIQGPTAVKLKDGKYQKGSGMDMAKWDAMSSSISELRNQAQQDECHCIWEGHLEKKTEGKGDEEVEKDSLGIQGAGGKAFAQNVAEVFRIRRMIGQKVKGIVDTMYFDTQPSLSFMNNGRGFSELQPKEYDLTKVLNALNYTTGNWGKVKGKVVTAPVPKGEDDE